MFEGTGKVRKHQRQENLGAQTAGAVCRTIAARFQLQEVSVGLESSKLRRRPAGRRQLQEALHNSSPAAAGTLDLEGSAAKSIWDTKLLQENFAGPICRNSMQKYYSLPPAAKSFRRSGRASSCMGALQELSSGPAALPRLLQRNLKNLEGWCCRISLCH